MGFGTALRKDLYRHINSLSHKEIDKIGTPSLLTRMTNDVNQAQTGVNMFLRLFLRSPFIVIGSIIMCLTINVELTLIFAVAAPIIGLIIYLVMTKTIPRHKKIQHRLDKVSLNTRENLSGVRVIRAFSQQENEAKDFEEETRALKKAQLSVGRISALLNPLTYVVVNIAIIAIIWFGGGKVNTGEITQGEVTALVNYMTQILLALIYLANLIVILTKASASTARVNDIFAIKPSVTDENNIQQIPDKDAPAVEFSEATFSYSGTEPALSSISFSAAKGETIGIVGGTGSGKSTLINLIPRFYDLTGGRLLIDGIDVKNYPLEQLRKKIGIVPQRAVLFKGTIRENMQWGNADATDEEIWQALELAQAKDFVEQKPEKLDTIITQGGKNLSGGQRQRLTIARALIMKPDILILDDSSSALDYATAEKLRKALLTAFADTTAFIVSQRASSIRHADKIIVLDDGEIAGIGTHESLFGKCPEYREICLSQMTEKEAQNG